MSDWIRELAVHEATKARIMNGGRPFDTADMEVAMRKAVAKMGELIVCRICEQEAAHPEFRGTCWGRKDGGGVAMSWSRALIQVAGGLEQLFAEWEPGK